MRVSPRVQLSCVVLTLNEESNVRAAITSLAPADQIVVVDCGSTDRTVQISRALGADVLENQWPGYANQRNWALKHPALRHEWVLFVDADERVSSEGWEEIRAFLADPGDASAADFRRSVRLFGRELRHGGFNSARVTRLLVRDRCQFLERPVHEHAVVQGSIRHLRTPILHDDQKPFAAWIDRHNGYSTLEAQARLSPQVVDGIGGARVKGWIRAHLWPHLPARPLLFFLYVYVVRLGFLDGKAGLRIAAFYGFQELAVKIKMEELVARGTRRRPVYEGAPSKDDV